MDTGKSLKSLKPFISHSEAGLGPRASEILQYVFDHPECTQKQVADAVGVSRPRVSYIVGHPKVLKAFPILARRRMSGMLPQAVKRFETLMNQDENLEVSRKVVEQILKTEGVIENVQHIEVKNTTEIKTTEELKQLIERARDLPPSVIDAEIIVDQGNESRG
mgnify:CR=1 FL=1